ncbi:MAG: HAMP domain-containing histidine kinase [Salinivirgaceae bacterium]|nr:HAMP domain-containing histidine kinase [Salinivirgaceae bacterium]
MNFYRHKKEWKVALFLMAIAIGIFSLTHTNQLVEKMKVEEHKRMEVWAEATSYLASEDVPQGINFYLNVISKNTTIPVILTDGNDRIIGSSNLGNDKKVTKAYEEKRLQKMKKGTPPIEVNFLGGKNFIYYEDSTILKQLAIYPYIQLGIISIFILIAYFAFSSSRKAEQNQVWVGMSKETAHQLGTPISSLMAWLEIIEPSEQNTSYIAEMQKDVHRLQMIAERFSKIGSIPELPVSNLGYILENAVEYMKVRVSKNIEFITLFKTDQEVIIPLNKSLFSWVIENLIRNAVDAMDGKGIISLTLIDNEKEIFIEISDTGKGISKTKQKVIFNPGYTSKERGWGLGLSLSRRIIENYHKGKIFVQSSEPNQGTTFKIVLPK